LREKAAQLRGALEGSNSLPGGIYTAIAIGNTRRELRAVEDELGRLERDGGDGAAADS
jgi:hypothetical protein